LRRYQSLLDVSAVVFYWVLPLVIVVLLEKRAVRSLGLTVRRDQWLRFSLYAVAGLVFPALIVGVDRDLLLELLQQIAFIGLPEEVFFRGYLMARLCNWMGRWRGLGISAVLFGLGHFITLVSQHGLRHPLSEAGVGLYTAFGGLLLGYVFLRSQSVVPGAIIHVAANAYLYRLLERAGKVIAR